MLSFNILFREASAAIGQRLHDAATEAVRQVTIHMCCCFCWLLLLLVSSFLTLQQGSLPNPLAGMISGDAVAEALNRLGRAR